jgi:hypothetical protein
MGDRAVHQGRPFEPMTGWALRAIGGNPEGERKPVVSSKLLDSNPATGSLATKLPKLMRSGAEGQRAGEEFRMESK